MHEEMTVATHTVTITQAYKRDNNLNQTKCKEESKYARAPVVDGIHTQNHYNCSHGLFQETSSGTWINIRTLSNCRGRVHNSNPWGTGE